MVRRLSIFAILLFLASVANAQSTYYANSCSYADVNDCVNGSGANTCHAGSQGGAQATHTVINGDKVIVPAGTCTWTSNLNITKLILFLGSDPTNTHLGTCTGDADLNCGSAGGGTTVLIDNVDKSVCNTSQPLITFSNEAEGNGALEVGNFTAQGLNKDVGTCSEHIKILTASHSLRIHDMTFQQMTAAGVLIDGDEWGVFDHNTFTDTGASCTAPQASCHLRGLVVHHSRWQESGDYGDNSWFQPDTFGTAQEFYVENSTFNILNPEASSNMACEYGARCVMRYNNMEWTGGHGTESNTRNRSIRTWEFYSNNIRDHGQTITANALLFRGGTGMVFNNKVTTTLVGNYSNMTALNAYRRTGNASPWGPAAAPWNNKGGCYGDSPWDTNDGVTYYSGTATSGSTTDTLQDSTANFGATDNLIGFSVIDPSTSPWGSHIISNTSTSITTAPAAIGVAHVWTIGDSYQVQRATQCIDQPGVGPSILLSGASPSPVSPANNALDPLYASGNQLCNPSCSLYSSIFNSKYGVVFANQHYYDQLNAVGNGTTGTGTGTLAQRPATCTPKVGYWATDTNTLYQCVTTNTWTVYYTPYTYPHPLVVIQNTAPAPAVGMFALATPRTVVRSAPAGGQFGELNPARHPRP